MKKIIRKQALRVSSLIKLVGLNTTRSFTEKPSMEKQELPEAGAPPVNHATELFERFTADIIRERVVFTR